MSTIGGKIFVQAGTVALSAPTFVRNGDASVLIEGKGPSTVLSRSGNMPAGQGFIDIGSASDVIIRDLTIDGGVTTPATYVDGSLSTTFHPGGDDPMHPTLTLNSSLWIHGGATRVRIENVTFRHTGGYAIIIDARSGDIQEVEIINCKFENNRPFLCGPTGDLNYGSMPGGILYINTGIASINSYSVKGLHVTGNKWNRNDGVGVWGYGYGFDVLNSDVVIENNRFVDQGRDCIEVGNTIGGLVSNNHGRRVGYTTVDDTTASVPKWYQYTYAVFLDTTGYVSGVNYANNTVMSVNGGGIDLDGFLNGNVSGNKVVVPIVGDPNYVLDQVASYGPTGTPENVSKGIQSGNSYDSNAGQNINITGNTIVNCGAGGIVGKDLRNSLISGNLIYHPSVTDPAEGPIILFNEPPPAWSSTAAYAVGSLASYSGVDYISTAASTGQEPDTHPSSWTALPENTFQATGNTITGNTITFPGVGACIAELDTVFGVTNPFAPTSVNTIFNNTCNGTNSGEFSVSDNSSSVAQMSIPSNVNAPSAVSGSMLRRTGTGAAAALQVMANAGGTQSVVMTVGDTQGLVRSSVNSAAGTGGFVTGNRAPVVYDSASTGAVVLDAFLAVKCFDQTGSTYNSTNANLFDNTWMLLRANRTSGQLEVSLTESGSARVWTTIGSSSGGVAGAAGASTQVQFNTGGVLNASTNFVWTGTALAISGAYMQSSGGYLSGADAWNAFGDNGTVASGAILRGYGVAPFTASGTARGGYVDFAPLGYANYPVPLTGLSAFGSTDVLLWASGTNATSSPNTTIGLQTNAFVNAAGGFSTSNANSTAIQAPNGGVTALSLISIRNDAASSVTIARNSTTGGAIARTYGFAVTTGGSLLLNDDTAGTYRMALSTAGVFSFGIGSSSVSIDQAGNVTGAAVASFNGGFLSSSTAATAIQAPNGGVLATQGLFTQATFGDNTFPPLSALTVISETTANPRGLTLYHVTNDTNGVVQQFRKSRGTSTAPSAVQNGDNIGSFYGYGYDGANWIGTARIRFQIDNAVSSGTVPMAIAFRTGTTADTQAMIISSSGIVTIGSSTYAQFDTSGDLTITSTATNSIQTSGGIAGSALAVSSTASNAIQALGGGVTALSLISIRNDAASSVTIARNSTSGGAIARTYGFAVTTGGSLLLNDDTAGTYRMAVTTAGLVSFGTGSSAVSIDQAGNVSATGQGSFGSVTSTGSVGVSNQLVMVAQSGTVSGPSSGQFSFYASTTGINYWNGSGWVSLGSSSSSSSGGTGDIQFSNGAGGFLGNSNLSWNNSTSVMNVVGAIATSGVVQPSVAAGSLALQVYNTTTSLDSFQVYGNGQVNVSGPGTGNNYYANGDDLGGTLYVASTSYSAYYGGQILFGSGFGVSAMIKMSLQNGTGPAGDLFFGTRNSSGNVVERMRINDVGTVLMGTGNFTVDASGNASTTGAIASASINSAGYVQGNGFSLYSGGGVVISTTGVGAFNGLTTNGATINGTLLSEDSSSTPSSVPSGYGALQHKSGTVWWYGSPSGYGTIDFSSAGSTGVSSLSEGTGVGISGGTGSGSGPYTGALTLSIGQSVGTTATPTFAGVISTSAFNASYTSGVGTGVVAFQVDNSGATPFLVDCAGNVSLSGASGVNSTSGYRINGWTATTFVIDSSANINGASFNARAAASSLAVTIDDTTTSATTFQIYGSGALFATQLNTSGGLAVGSNTIIDGSGNVSANGNVTATGYVAANGVGNFSALEISGTTVIQASTGNYLGNVNTSGYVTASSAISGGSFKLGSATLVDSSQRVYASSFYYASGPTQLTSGTTWLGGVSTTSYVAAAYFQVGSTTVINASNQWVGGEILSTGNVAAYTGYVFAIGSGSTYSYGVSNSSTATPTAILTNGGIVTYITTTSDARLKNIEKRLSYGLRDLAGLQVALYRWNARSSIYGTPPTDPVVGFISQEIQSRMPEACFYDQYGYLGFHKDVLFGALINSVNELSAQNRELSAQVQKLTGLLIQ